MTIMVPFDATARARAALWRGRQLTTALDEALVAVSVVPADAGYARAKAWIGPEDDCFDRDDVIGRLRDQVTAITPTAGFRCLRVDGVPTPEQLAERLRTHAVEVGVSVLVLGCDPRNGVAPEILSREPAERAASRSTFDVMLVRRVPAVAGSCGPGVGN